MNKPIKVADLAEFEVAFYLSSGPPSPPVKRTSPKQNRTAARRRASPAPMPARSFARADSSR
jgi:hypothetical protein